MFARSCGGKGFILIICLQIPAVRQISLWTNSICQEASLHQNVGKYSKCMWIKKKFYLLYFVCMSVSPACTVLSAARVLSSHEAGGSARCSGTVVMDWIVPCGARSWTYSSGIVVTALDHQAISPACCGMFSGENPTLESSPTDLLVNTLALSRMVLLLMLGPATGKSWRPFWTSKWILTYAKDGLGI